MTGRGRAALFTLLAGASLAGCASSPKPAPERTSGLTIAAQDRLFTGVQEILKKSGPADAQSKQGGELLTQLLVDKARAAGGKPAAVECFAAGCSLDVEFGQVTGTVAPEDEAKLADGALTLNRAVAEDHKNPLIEWGGSWGRTVLLRDAAGRVFESWFVFAPGRAITPEFEKQQKIKRVPTMQGAAAKQEAR